MNSYRVVAWHGQGAYGSVYRAVPVGQEHLGPVALKLSLYPWDQRFAREAQLLSRLSHPSIPRLLGSGVLRSPAGTEHPWFAMEWVEGTPLYAWAEQHAASHHQVCRVLAQLARALEALHSAGAVHRDVKGDNVLVRLSDRLPVLIDFGSGHFQGAPRLTWQSLAPGTPEYLSPQACLFDIRSVRDRNGYYPPSPSDDLFALGVTAYRLVLGEYPPALRVQEDEQGSWLVTSPDIRPLLENNPQVPPVLREWLVRLLSDDPQQRGSAAELAQALEAAAEETVPELPPVSPQAAAVAPPDAPAPSGTDKRPECPCVLPRPRAWKPWLAWAAMALWVLMPWSQPSHVAVSPEQASESTTAVGDTTPPEPRHSSPPSPEPSSLSQETPSAPAPEQPLRQARPNAKGQCPMRTQLVFNGLCWVELASMTAEACVGNGYMLFKGKCYAPGLEVPRKAVPTSSPRR